MNTIQVPDELALELDRLAGTERRSDYAVDVLWREIRRTRQKEALRSSAGTWKQADHPELARGGAAYVDEIRSERDDRFEDALNPQRKG